MLNPSVLFDSLRPYGPCQAPLSMGFPKQEYWSGLPFLSPGDLPNPGIEPVFPALLVVSSIPSGFFTSHQGNPEHAYILNAFSPAQIPITDQRGLWVALYIQDTNQHPFCKPHLGQNFNTWWVSIAQRVCK